MTVDREPANRYNEDEALTAYIWRNYRRLISDTCRFEDRVSYMKGGFVGHETFRRVVVERVLKEKGDKIIINRCPACDRIADKPSSTHCRWCEHGWVREGPEPPSEDDELPSRWERKR